MCEYVPIEPATFNRPLAAFMVEFSAQGMILLPESSSNSHLKCPGLP